MENIRLFRVSLGCDKNLVDTEKMLRLLNGRGITFTDGGTKADMVLVNTCCFIGGAKEESVSTTLDMARCKEEGNLKALPVAEYLIRKYKQETLGKIPEVDAILGTTSYKEVAKVLNETPTGRTDTHPSCFHGLSGPPQTEIRRVTAAGGHYAFLRIAEGCGKRYTYCTVPYLRSLYRSVPTEQLVKEARRLTEVGVKELIPVTQETTLYSRDLHGERCLPGLLRELAKILGIYRTRIQYCYPEETTDELIETIRAEEKMCDYLDISTQHTSDRVLKRMGRRTNKEELVERTGESRQKIPDTAIRTILISGFLGKTESDHEELVDSVNEMEFERLGVFVYSAKEDTPAFSYPDQVPEEVKEECRNKTIELQQDIAFGHYGSMVGRAFTAPVEGRVMDESAYVGRTYMDVSNVDGLMFVDGNVELMSGDFVRVKVTGVAECDLIGEVYNEFAQ